MKRLFIAKSLKETFIPGLKHIGLECFGFAHTKQTSQTAERGTYGHKHIGSAIFAKTEKFTLISSKRVHLKDYGKHYLFNFHLVIHFVEFVGIKAMNQCKSHNFYIDVMSKYNSMVMMLIKIKSTNETCIIANTHLYWNPNRADIKTFQTYAAMDAISHFATSVSHSFFSLV